MVDGLEQDSYIHATNKNGTLFALKPIELVTEALSRLPSPKAAKPRLILNILEQDLDARWHNVEDAPITVLPNLPGDQNYQ